MRTALSPFEDLDAKVHEWIMNLRTSGYIVTQPAIRLQALQIAKEMGLKDFKASSGWCSNFMNRRELCLRQRTHIAQKLPAEVDCKVTAFHKFVIDLRYSNELDLGSIGNMDETPMFFDMPGNRTVDEKGVKTVSVKTTGAEKQHFTVVVSCLADGTKLKLAIVLKRKTMPKDKLPAGVILYVQPKGWVDESILMDWLRDVWFTRPGTLLNRKSLLVWDMFRAHLLDSVKVRLKQNRTYQAVIPGGCTSLLQPLDVCLNKPFKVNMRAKWNDWMVSGTKELTKAGNLKPPDIATVCQWVIDSWESIPAAMVMKSFLKCGISNSLNDTQDVELFADLVETANGKADACESEGVVSEFDKCEDDNRCMMMA